MPQSIYVIGAFIKVTIRAFFNPDNVPWITQNRKEPFLNEQEATLELSNKPWKSNLNIQAIIEFPNHTWRINNEEIKSMEYWQMAETVFTNITHDDGKLNFSDIGPVKLRIHPLLGNWTDKIENSLFRFLGGSALVSASNNPQIPVIKIRLVLGLADAWSITENLETKDPEWKITTEGGKSSGDDNNGSQPNKAGIGSDIWDIVTWGPKKVLDVVRDVEFKVSYERSGGGGSRQKGLSRTYGKLSEEAEWTLSLQLPEPKPKPVPATTLTFHKVYFLTGKKDLIGPNNIPSKFPDNQDQIKSLQEFMNTLYGKYGYKNISTIELVGNASGLGDSAGNLNLSEQRALYVKERLRQMYSEIPQSIIFSKGAPPGKSNKDNDPYDRRVDINVFLKDKNVRML